MLLTLQLKYLRHTRHVLVLGLGFLFSQVTAAQANDPTLVGNLLTLPVVDVGGVPYRVEFDVIDNSGAITIVLKNALVVSGADTSGAPFLYDRNGKLAIPHLPVSGASYWGEFQMASSTSLQLLRAGINTPRTSAIDGYWWVTESMNEPSCGGAYTDEYRITAFQDGNVVIVNFVNSYALSGSVATKSGSYVQNGRTITYTSRFEFSATSYTGTETFTSASASDSCSGTVHYTGRLMRH